MKIVTTVNGKEHKLDVDEEMPILWALRDVVGLTGTKFGCGRGLCGACTVHLDGEAIRSCVNPISYANGKKIVTIEGLSEKGNHPVQKCWVEMGVPQCGFCQSGQIMAATVLLRENKSPNDDQIAESMTNLCRCGTYTRIRDAIKKVAASGESV